MAENDALEIPDDARTDAGSFEILRLWIANNDQHVSLRMGVWEDPAAWGIMLADLARHVAASYAQDARLDPGEALERIKEGLDAELR
jgi:uncharacterized protein DUF5076